MDLRTIYLSSVLTDFLNLIFIAILWVQNRKRYEGLHWLTIAYVFHFTGITLIFLRGIIPDFFSIVFSNMLNISSAYLTLVAMERFIGWKPVKNPNILLIVFFTVIQIYFTYYKADLEFRNVNIAVFLFYFTFQTSWVLLYKTPDKLKPMTRNAGIAFLIFSFINVVRICLLFITIDHQQNYFKTGIPGAVVALSYQMTLLLISYFLLLMINRRLVYDITLEEQKLLITYHAVPYAIFITRARDGKILNVNEGFERILHYRSNEAIGKTSLQLGLWESQSEREEFVEQLKKEKIVKEKDFSCRKKTGELISSQISGINITIDNEECILSVVNDITERKKNENEIKRSRDILNKLLIDLQSEHEQQKINLATQIDNQLNQSLAILRINIGLLKKKLTTTYSDISENIIQLIDSTYQQTGQTIERSLGLMSNMRNEVLYLFGIVEAISLTVEELQKNSDLTCTLHCNTGYVTMENSKSSVLYNVFKEVINSILLTNKANILEITIDKENETLMLTITENGNSFDTYFNPEETNTTIQILKEKVTLIDGLLSIDRNEKGITNVTLRLPLLVHV